VGQLIGDAPVTVVIDCLLQLCIYVLQYIVEIIIYGETCDACSIAYPSTSTLIISLYIVYK